MATYKKGKRIISISKPPYREKIGLMIGEKNTLELVASFKSPEHAKKFEDILDYFLGWEGK